MPLVHRTLPKLLVICLVLFFSCTKKSESPAGKVAGTYKGSVFMNGTRYVDYIVKIDFLEKDKIRASCQSTPTAFSAVEINVTSINGVVTTHLYTGGPGLQYYPEHSQLSLNVGTQSFMGFKQ